MKNNNSKPIVDKAGEGGAARAKQAYLKYGILAAAAVVIIAVALIIYFSVSKSYVATVGSEKIGTGEFSYYLDYQKTILFGEAQSADPNLTEEAFWNSNIQGENAFELAKRKTLESLRDIKIQLIKAKEAGTKLEAAEKDYIDSAIDGIIEQYGSSIKANTALKQEGLSLDVFRKMYEDIFMTNKFREAEYTAMDLKAEDIKEYYDKNQGWYLESSYRKGGEEAVWARHILIQVAEDATQEEKDAAKKKAQDILAKAKAGEDFAKLASENTEDPGSKETGGEYLFGISSSMVPEFKEAAFALNPGEISDLVETDFGYHILKLEEKYAKDEPASLKCATEYNEYGIAYVQYKLYSEKLEEWKKDAKFEIKKNKGVYDSIKN